MNPSGAVQLHNLTQPFKGEWIVGTRDFLIEVIFTSANYSC
jgi:hypothetical protein